MVPGRHTEQTRTVGGAELSEKGSLGLGVSMSKPPMGGARVWDVGAICSCADGAAEVLAEVSVVLTDPGDRLADSAGHRDSGTL